MSGKPRKYVSVIIVVAIAFVAGMITTHLVSRVGSLREVARVVQIMPQLLQLENAPSIPAATDLRPLQTFWEVRRKVREAFVYEIEDDKTLTYGAIRGMLAALDDPWTRFYTPEEYKEFKLETEGHFDGIGAVLKEREIGDKGEGEVYILTVFPEGPAAKSDILPQDVIVVVDEIPVKGMSVDAVAKRIRGKAGTTVKLGLRREGEGELVQVDIVRAEIDIPVIEHEMLEKDIGYVWLRTFNRQAEVKLRAALEDLSEQGMRGLVLDLSLNGGGLLDMAVAVSSMFVDDTPVVYVQERGQPDQPLNARPGVRVDAGIPMVVLVDHGSASASEIVAGCLQDVGRAPVVGQNTFGKSKVQTVAELNDKSALILSTAVYLTPKKRDIGLEYEDGKRGVKPDRFFPEPDLEALKDTRDWWEDWHDDQIRQAVEVLEEGIAENAGG